jgi:pimeloyl-ACP methyl ester carboxylesterase
MRAALLALVFAGLAGGVSAGEGAWSPFVLDAGGRKLVAAMPEAAGPVLTVVIEGDGAAHDSGGRPSADPTPRRPTALALAKAWPGSAAWLGRLCQQVRALDPRCGEADWTSARYSDEAVRAAGAAVDALKVRAGASHVVLVGWSGGGVIAALLAARRADVAGLVTIASPLDLAAWTQARGLSPLTDSLDPRDLPPLGIPQAHLFGAFDPVVPASQGVPAARRLGGPDAIVQVWRERHACCWSRQARAIAALLAEVSDVEDPLAGQTAELRVRQDHLVSAAHVDDDVRALLADGVARLGRKPHAVALGPVEVGDPVDP